MQELVYCDKRIQVDTMVIFGKDCDFPIMNL